MDESLRHLNKEDLFLLMESYRNMVQMNTTLVEQQKQIMSLLNSITNKQDTSALNQTKSFDQITRVNEKLENCISILTKTNEAVSLSISSIDKSFVNGIVEVNETIRNTHVEDSKQHSGINTRIYVSMGAMASIIVALISLSITLANKYTLLSNIQDILNKISTFLNIGP